MRLRPDVDDIQTTKTEKLLAVVLTGFLLLGAIWTYQRLDDVVRSRIEVPQFRSGPASERLQAASRRLGQADIRYRRALQDLELRREAYRTALDAGDPAPRLRAQYNAAQAELSSAETALDVARRDVKAESPAADAEQRTFSERLDAALDRQQRWSFFVRFAFVSLCVVGAYGLLVWMRRRNSRWFPLAGSAVAAATIFAFVFASDYLTDYFDPFDWGIAAIAALGIAATLAVYWSVQRYLLRRMPQRRVKRGQCPFCGYAVRGNMRCEGCGREVVAPCTACEAPRRVGTAYCGTCGSTAAVTRIPA
jgi:hypothetical protein